MLNDRLKYHFENPHSTEYLGEFGMDKGPTFDVWTDENKISLWRRSSIMGKLKFEEVESFDPICAVILAKQLIDAAERVWVKTPETTPASTSPRPTLLRQP